MGFAGGEAFLMPKQFIFPSSRKEIKRLGTRKNTRKTVFFAHPKEKKKNPTLHLSYGDSSVTILLSSIRIKGRGGGVLGKPLSVTFPC